MDSLFSTDKVNTGRQLELDIAKGFAIIFMILVHCGIVADYFVNDLSFSYSVIVEAILGQPCSAPVFMFCMGLVLVYSRNTAYDVMIKRGIKLFILGVIVNIGEFIIPHYLFGTLFNSWDMINIYNGLLLFTCDILGFAALFFIVFGVFKKLNLSNKQLLAIGIILSLFGSIFRLNDFGSIYLNLIFGYFIGTSIEFTSFPLFNWILFPIA